MNFKKEETARQIEKPDTKLDMEAQDKEGNKLLKVTWPFCFIRVASVEAFHTLELYSENSILCLSNIHRNLP